MVTWWLHFGSNLQLLHQMTLLSVFCKISNSKSKLVWLRSSLISVFCSEREMCMFYFIFFPPFSRGFIAFVCFVKGHQSCRYNLWAFPSHTAICRLLQVPECLLKSFVLILCPSFLPLPLKLCFCFFFFLSFFLPRFLVLPLISQC